MTQAHMQAPASPLIFNFTPATTAAHIFRPPDKSAMSTPATNDYFSPRTRKRVCPGTVDVTPDVDLTGGFGAEVEERYRLRGGFDTPGLLMEVEMTPGVSEERGRFSDWSRADESPGRSELVCGPLARERNGAGRGRASAGLESKPASGWGSFAFRLVGRVVSMGTTVIRGFYAGGGPGYAISSPSADVLARRPQLQASRAVPTVPGAWEEDQGFTGDFEQDNPRTSQPSRPPNKRRHTNKDAWILVGTPDADDASPKRKLSNNPPIRRTMASRPSARRSIAGSPRALVHSPCFPSGPDSSSRRASIAPTRDSRPSSSNGTFITPEAERYVKRQARKDKAADKAVSSMTRRLEDLIRQGQEALGTKVDVDEGSADEAAWL